MISRTLVIWLLSYSDNGTSHVRMGSYGVRAPVWTDSGMRHWKRLIKIPGGTDCYYCINNMTCLIHVYLLLCLVHVTLSVVAYYACSALHLFYFHMPTCMFILHMPTCMVTAITSPLDDSIYDINRTRLKTWPDDNRLGSDGIKR